MINKTITSSAILDIVNEHEIDEKKSNLSEKGLQTYRKYTSYLAMHYLHILVNYMDIIDLFKLFFVFKKKNILSVGPITTFSCLKAHLYQLGFFAP